MSVPVAVNPAVSTDNSIPNAYQQHRVSAGHNHGPPAAVNVQFCGDQTYYVLAGDTPVLVHNCGEGIREASDAAFSAADNPGSIFIKDKHLASFQGNYAKFATTDKSAAQSLVSEALRSDRAVFRSNGLDGTFKIETDLGRIVGTKGQTGVRAIVSFDGRVINAFPINIGP